MVTLSAPQTLWGSARTHPHWVARNYTRNTFKIVAIVAQMAVFFWYSTNLYLLIGRGLPLSWLWPFGWTFNLSIWQEGMFNHSVRSGNLFGYGIHSWRTVERGREGETEAEFKAFKMNVFHWLTYHSCLQLVCLHLCNLSLDIFIVNLILDRNTLSM